MGVGWAVALEDGRLVGHVLCAAVSYSGMEADVGEAEQQAAKRSRRIDQVQQL